MSVGPPGAIPPGAAARGRLTGGCDARLAATIARAARCRPGKLMLTDRTGAHREYPLPPGLRGVAPRATRCYFNLEASAPDLCAALRPPDLPTFAVDRINLYVSHGRGGAALHFDTRAVVVIQLSGTKLWRYSRHPAIADPHRTCLAPRRGAWIDYDGRMVALPSRLDACVLAPGDWLMLPPATWHETFTLDGSVSATLAAPAPACEI